MPGSAFGAGGEGFFRISFITSPERIAEAARRAGTRAGVDRRGGRMKRSPLDDRAAQEGQGLDRPVVRDSRVRDRAIASITFSYPLSSLFSVTRQVRRPNASSTSASRPPRPAGAVGNGAAAEAKNAAHAEPRAVAPAVHDSDGDSAASAADREPWRHLRNAHRHRWRSERHGDRHRAGAPRPAHRAASERAASAALDGAEERQRGEGDLRRVSRGGDRGRGEPRPQSARLDDDARRPEVRPRLAVHLPRQVQDPVGDSRRAAVQLRRRRRHAHHRGAQRRPGFRTTSTRTRRG